MVPCAILADAYKTFVLNSRLRLVFGGACSIMADANVELLQIGAYPVTRLLEGSSTSRHYLGKHPIRKKDVFIRVQCAPFVTNEAKEAFLARAIQLKKFSHRFAVPVLDFGLTQQSDTT